MWTRKKFQTLDVELMLTNNYDYLLFKKHTVVLCIFMYYIPIFGGRPLYRNYETDLGLRYLSNDDFPDYRTINLFRINFKEEIADIFLRL